MPAAESIASDFSTRCDQGIAWMNRGHALMTVGDAAGLAAALEAYGEAIVILRDLPVATNPSWANSLGAAYMNHGQLLHRIHGISRATASLTSFEAAGLVLRAVPAGENPWPRRNLTGTLVNRANLLLDLARLPDALAAAREALALSRPHERTDPVEADLALKARRALCDALGQLLVMPGAEQEALAAEASDLVDDALALVRDWTGRSADIFRLLALRFFHYGVQLYRFHQPHFLTEFIAENMPFQTDDFRDIALEAVAAALSDRPRNRPFLTVGDPASERQLHTWRELEALRVRLAA